MQRMSHWLLLLLVLGASPAGAQEGWRAEVVARDLNYPWAIARSGQTLLLTEAAGNIVMVEGGRAKRQRVHTREPLVQEGGGGLLGLALAPDFARSGRAFVYHGYRRNGSLFNRVIELRRDGQTWRETRQLIDGIPGHTLYNGGRLAIGTDGHLYVATGWANNPALAPDLQSLGGKVLRLQLDGGVPADNPFPGSPVYSFGHRNPQGLAWDASGRLLVVEHGSGGNDEINRVEPGANYGGPDSEGNRVRPDTLAPLLHSGSDTWAPSGAVFHDGQLLIAALRGQGLYAWRERERSLRQVFDAGERLRDVLVADGTVYVITTNASPRSSSRPAHDRLLRLTSMHLSNPPTSRP
jgi:glucose/arabinose dehydrogenase